MKTISVKILGHPLEDPFGYSFFLYKTLTKHFNVLISENPDYLFYHDSTPEHINYRNAVKIFYTGENISPNFNECDYAISFDRMSFEDRHFRLPLYIIAPFYSKEEFDIAGKHFLENPKKITLEDLKKKDSFCSFVYSNYRASPEREEVFKILSSYKKVSSAGSYLNNTNNQKIKNKLSFEKKHKFVVAFENSSRSGYVTEKIVSAFAAGSIPIYWGDPSVHLEFNQDRFINCHNFKTYEDILKKIIQIDSDDELYLNMVNQPILKTENSIRETLELFETFIINIFNQPIEKAKRCSINPVKKKHQDLEKKLLYFFWKTHSKIIKIIAFVYKPFKKILFLERLKVRILKN